ncbi:hypothetical protein O7606_10610 [Micromonospora sp. WMMD882]|uniref:hypothetical protein n=1 Tax=Micromonospora sp. WMMD882 TaxID=3015151 RepID=UPI00248B2CDB|nr:hypothetical protein [Micromonospora sp. WMMD882]WBB82361.1 hypothetical protein O7606_10610 [Micromonospora sp. WMMD882]
MVTTALLALGLTAATGCVPAAHRAQTRLPVGYDSFDGALAVWPPRGGLADDADATAAVTEAVRAWRSPVDDRAHLATSGILWSGEVDGAGLALVAADVPGESASWLLQLAAAGGGRYEVTRAVEHTDPGYLVYSDVLPVQLGAQRRYLTSTRVQRLTDPDGRPLAVAEGLTAPVAVPACAAVGVTATLRPTASLPRGRAADRLLDLGTAIEAPRYPLVRDESGAGRRALAGLDTCQLAGEDGPFASVPRRVRDRDTPDSVPRSWPVEEITARVLGEITLGGGPAAELKQVSWHSEAGTMTSLVHRPAGDGPAVVSRADRANPLQAYVLPVPGQPLVVLSWRASRDSSLSTPPGTRRLVDRPGLVVVPQPAEKQTFSLAGAERTYYRSVDGR